MKTSLEIFRPGTHTAMSGATLNFSEADLAACAKAYDPAKHEAPLVVGHPKHDDPAYGWVKSLSFVDGSLGAVPDQVNPEFKAQVAAGAYKKLSASFYIPEAPANPVPGVYYLRHVGFLGAQAPALKGMKTPTFDAAADEAGVVAFSDLEIMAPPAGAPNPAEAEEALRMSAELAKKEAELKVKEEAHAKAEADLKVKEEAHAKAEAELKAKEAASVVKEETAAKQEAEAYAEGLVTGGKLPPTQKAGVVALLLANRAHVVEFGEGDAKTNTGSFLKTLLESLPKRLDFGESANAELAVPTADFACAPGCTVDPAALEIHSKALAFQEANPTVTYLQAIKTVSKANR